MIPVQDIQIPKHSPKKHPSETIKSKDVSMKTFYNNYIKHKHSANDISAISHNHDVNSQNKINYQEHKMRFLETELKNLKKNTKLKKDNNRNLKLSNFFQRTNVRIIIAVKIII